MEQPSHHITNIIDLFVYYLDCGAHRAQFHSKWMLHWPVKCPFLLVYLNDIVLFSKLSQQHIDNDGKTLTTLENASVAVNYIIVDILGKRSITCNEWTSNKVGIDFVHHGPYSGIATIHPPHRTLTFRSTTLTFFDDSFQTFPDRQHRGTRDYAKRSQWQPSFWTTKKLSLITNLKKHRCRYQNYRCHRQPVLWLWIQSLVPSRSDLYSYKNDMPDLINR